MTDEKSKAAKPNDPFGTVPRVAEPPAEQGKRLTDGRLIKRDEHGRAYTESNPTLGGIRTYLDEEEFPPEMPDGDDPPPLPAIVPPQAAATAASQFEPAPPEELDARPALQTSAELQPPIVPPMHAAPAAGVPTFSTSEAAAAEAKKAAQPAATQAVIEAVLAHPAAQPSGAKP